MQKLLIADPSEEYCGILADALRGTYLVKVCQDGKDALNAIQSYRPDVLVLDLMMPGVDGIGLLKAAEKLERRPAILAMTRFVSDFMMDQVSRLGVGYVMLKSCEVQAVVARIGELTQQMERPAVTRPDARTEATNMLLALGISTKLQGYAFLREALLLSMEDPGQSVTKELYPAVGVICGGNAQQVERSIRSAIQSAWQRRDEQVWRMSFQAMPDGRIPRPTNATFISRLADRLLMSRNMAM